MNQKTNEVDGITVSSAVLQSILGLTDRRVRQLAQEGTVVRVSRGKYSLVSSVQNYVTYIKTTKETAETPKKLDYEDERALHERIKREKSELTLKLMKGELHKTEDVERVMNDMLANFRSKVLAIPSKVAPRLIYKDDVNNIQDTIEIEVVEALQELSEYDPSLFYSDEYIDVEDGEAIEEETNSTKKDS
ncbi:hypothetical protein AN1V17_47200 [Vallitalea sediminicola]